MPGPGTIIAIILAYVGILFLIATWVENRTKQGKKIAGKSLLYAASLAIYCTTWTFYGIVGSAARLGHVFLALYIGPTIVFIFGNNILKRFILLKNKFRITNIADLISVRYGKSQLLAALVAIICVIGISPYIALQLKAMISTFDLLTQSGSSSGMSSSAIGIIFVLLMIFFTIMFGVRRLDPTERHEGIVVAVAVESLFKLVTSLIVGIFIVYGVYNGFTDIFTRFELGNFELLALNENNQKTIVINWTTYTLLSMSAILFLPRQFHITVVENSDVNHLRKAIWFFPLYMFLITIFILPLALSGIMQGLRPEDADYFSLLLPIHFDKPVLAILLFLGGFSAGTGMIMICAMTLSTMIVNHLILPLVTFSKRFYLLNRHVLHLRWIAVTLVIFLGYFFERKLGNTYTLLNMGVMSFAAALQFAPVVLASLFWRKGNKTGAIMGLTGGFLLWLYTLLLPSLAHGGVLPESFVTEGPFGIGFLRPENIFGLIGIDRLSNAIFWTMLANIGLFIFGSLYFGRSSEEDQLADEFVDILKKEKSSTPLPESRMKANLREKTEILKNVLMQYYSETESEMILKKCLIELELDKKEKITVANLAQLQGEVETVLAGAIGAAIAHKVVSQAEIFLEHEAKALQNEISKVLADLRMTPERLVRRIDYLKERESLMKNHADELEAKLLELKEQVNIRKKAQKALSESERKYRMVIENSLEGIYIHQEFIVQFCNERFASMFGYDSAESMIGIHIREIVSKKSWEKVLDQVVTREDANTGVSQYNLIGKRQDGSEFEVETLACTIEYMGAIASQGVVRDISEKRILEDRLRQAQKMEAVGRLAGGVAHDFNNILTAISGYADLALTMMEEGSESYEDIEAIIQSTERAAELTRQLLAFSRKQVIKPRIINTGDTILELEKMLGRLISENIKLDFDLSEDLWKIKADPLQIEQIIVNLAVNSRDAMPEGGRLLIQAENAHIDANMEELISDINTGSYVKISVSDTGSGISEEDIEHLFEPFYTTKEVGKGTGLGLATVYGIVNQNNGTIKCYSNPGTGTTFNVFLPAVEGEASVKKQEEVLENYAVSGDETVLVVEDEDVVRKLAVRSLKDYGYTVHESPSPLNAIEVCRKLDKNLDIILSDVIMPEMNGPDMIKEIQKFRPDVKVLFMSGYPREVITHQGKLNRDIAFISKPFRPQDICRSVRKVLDDK